MTHYCMALGYSDEISFVWTDHEDNRSRCGVRASILVRIGGEAVWLCAHCYDLYCAWCGQEPGDPGTNAG